MSSKKVTKTKKIIKSVKKSSKNSKKPSKKISKKSISLNKMLTSALYPHHPVSNFGLCWHVHHFPLVEYCTNIPGRIRSIRQKPENEIAKRLYLLKKVKHSPINSLTFTIDRISSVIAHLEKTSFPHNHPGSNAISLLHIIQNDLIRYVNNYISNNKKDFIELHKEECGCDWTPECGINFNTPLDAKSL